MSQMYVLRTDTYQICLNLHLRSKLGQSRHLAINICTVNQVSSCKPQTFQNFLCSFKKWEGCLEMGCLEILEISHVFIIDCISWTYISELLCVNYEKHLKFWNSLSWLSSYCHLGWHNLRNCSQGKNKFTITIIKTKIIY